MSLRTALRPALLLLLLSLLAGPRAAADEKADDIERRKQDLLLRLRVHRAIDRGALWLAGRQQRDGSFEIEGQNQQGPFPQSRHRFGESALCTLTLAHCGYGVDKAEIRKAIAYLKKHWRSYLKGDFWPQASSYSLSILVLALHELYAQEPDADDAADRQRYGSSVKRRGNPCDYPQWVRAVMKKLLDWMLEHRSDRGLFRYPNGLPDGGTRPGPPPGGPAGGGRGPPGGGGPGGPPPQGQDIDGPEDLSNSQYVLLALWIGTRCGYEIDKATLEHIANRLIAWQERDGPRVRRVLDPVDDKLRGRYGAMNKPKDVMDRVRGFGYTPGDPPTGSMTTAGLSSLAIVKAMLVEQHKVEPELRGKLDQAIWDALAWLMVNFTVEGNPMPRGAFGAMPDAMWHYYYLYGLERACVIVGKRFLGDKDWYKIGARMLVDAQKADGRWQPPSSVGGWGGPGPGGPTYDTAVLDTCFALLFLKRAAMLPKHPTLPPPVTTPTEKDTPEEEGS